MGSEPSSPDFNDDMKTVHGVACWLDAIADDDDCNIDRDYIAEVCGNAASRLRSMQQSLIQEVDRIEKLQPFFTDVCAAVERARGNS